MQKGLNLAPFGTHNLLLTPIDPKERESTCLICVPSAYSSRDFLLKEISLINLIHRDKIVHGFDNIGNSENPSFQDGLDELFGL